jgi:hypothetical protein
LSGTNVRLASYITMLPLCLGVAAAQEPSASGVQMTVRIDMKSKTGALLSRDEKTREYSSIEMCEHIAREEQAIAEEHLADQDRTIEISCSRPNN